MRDFWNTLSKQEKVETIRDILVATVVMCLFIIIMEVLFG